jgi:hypothetical protein
MRGPHDAAASGGMASGGMASGGTASGGMASGGTASGGTASGGTASGGTASGGTASGGTASGGMASGHRGRLEATPAPDTIKRAMPSSIDHGTAVAFLAQAAEQRTRPSTAMRPIARGGAMRLINHLIPAIVTLGASCAHYNMFECQADTSCNLGPGGRCQASPGANQLWCSYPDPECPSGYRYSDFAVGDRECVPATPIIVDAGVDARTVDAFVAPPAITAFSPDWGSTSGGTFVRMLGFGFTGPHLAVKFGSSSATQLRIVSDTELTLMTPVGPHSPVNVTVTTDGGTASRTVKYRYLAPL